MSGPRPKLLLFAALLRPGVALACPVCFSAANEKVLSAYHFTAALMTLLPLVILGSIAGWLHRRFRACRPEFRADGWSADADANLEGERGAGVTE